MDNHNGYQSYHDDNQQKPDRLDISPQQHDHHHHNDNNNHNIFHALRAEIYHSCIVHLVSISVIKLHRKLDQRQKQINIGEKRISIIYTYLNRNTTQTNLDLKLIRSFYSFAWKTACNVLWMRFTNDFTIQVVQCPISDECLFAKFINNFSIFTSLSKQRKTNSSVFVNNLHFASLHFISFESKMPKIYKLKRPFQTR